MTGSPERASVLDRVADDFFLMANDDPSGRPRLPERILGLGLAAALLCELYGVEAIDVVGGEVVVTSPEAVSHGLTGSVLKDLSQEERRPVRDWLDYLGQTAPEAVAHRMQTYNLVYLKPSRARRLGRRGRWIPVDKHKATWPAIDVASKVFYSRADARALMLLGLTRATGLDNPCLWEIRDRLKEPAVLEPLARCSPPLLDLLAHTEAAVGSAIASQRSG